MNMAMFLIMVNKIHISFIFVSVQIRNTLITLKALHYLFKVLILARNIV